MHSKVLAYDQKSENFFPTMDIKGGVVIFYHDKEKEFEPIGIFTNFKELNSIAKKVLDSSEFESFADIVTNRGELSLF